MDLAPYIKSILGLLFVIGLILVALRFLKRFYNISYFKSDKSRILTLEDIVYIDSKTKIILIKRDDVRHLLITNEHNHLLIETIRDRVIDKTNLSVTT